MSARVEEVLHMVAQNRDRVVAVLIHLNDTYLLEERAEQRLPGFARVIATVQHIRAQVRKIFDGRDLTLVLHSGDFLGPSRTGKKTKGKAMVGALNRLGLDWCVPGNHEFDYKEKTFIQRMTEATFKCTVANVKTRSVPIAPKVLWPNADNPVIALTGIVSESVYKNFPSKDMGWEFTPPHIALADFVAETSTAPFHVVLTHGTRVEDRELRRYGLPARTLLLGGHDHDIHWIEDDGHPIMKNLSNLQTVRVILLFAGGVSAWQQLFGAHNTEYQQRSDHLLDNETLEEFLRRSKAHRQLNFIRAAGLVEDPDKMKALEDASRDPAALRFPDHKEILLTQLHEIDANLFRASWIQLDAEDLRGDYTLEQAIAWLRPGLDWRSFLLRYEDHDKFTEEDLEFINQFTSTEDGSDIVRDFSKEFPSGIDVREESIRRTPNAFGSFVAECVRLETKSDLAILNSGSFRSDARLASVLRTRDLLDCFLYDDESPVAVLNLPRHVVESLLNHGYSMSGSGAFPQISPAELPQKDPLRVAIASYLIEEPNSIDGYDLVLAKKFGIEREVLATFIRPNIVARCKIITAIKSQVLHANVPQVQAAAYVGDLADQFVLLAGAFINEFKRGVSTDLSAILAAVESDDDIGDERATTARNALRSWIRSLPKVREGESAMSQARAAYNNSASMDEVTLARTIREAHWALRSLYEALDSHPARFRDGLYYDSLLNHAAVGISAWRI